MRVSTQIGFKVIDVFESELSSKLSVSYEVQTTGSTQLERTVNNDECFCKNLEGWVREFKLTIVGYDDDVIFNDSFPEETIGQWLDDANIRFTGKEAPCDEDGFPLEDATPRSERPK